MTETIKNSISLEEIYKAQQSIKGVVQATPLVFMKNFSEHYNANIYFKREDLQVVRSYKIRGAYNKIQGLSKEQLQNGIVCASAGNHAQGVAFACKKLEVHGTIFMPVTTPLQKIEQVRMFGGNFVEVKLFGDSFDDSQKSAAEFCDLHKSTFVHPFDDLAVIAGQGTIGLEIINDIDTEIDYLFMPVGGGGLASGVGSVFKNLSPATKLIGVEPKGAPSLTNSLEKGENITLTKIEKFVDGAAVKRIGELTFEFCKELLDGTDTICEGLICATILKVYNENALVVEPAGALSIAALEQHKEQIEGKTVVCIVSGGNNDITRMEEMKERALLYQGLKHYFIIQFPQRAGALKEFVVDVLGPNDDIAYFEYTKKNNRDKGPAVVGIELKSKDDFEPLVLRMEQKGFLGEYLNDNPQLFQFLI
ncbi:MULTISPECIES: threonine ammonia-lyase IlvA [Flavobacteriaceae]|uniref:L-threonine dehydratase n=2 Tax=Flavobacteriaceae TaxID=49546 RepID=A0A4Y8ASY7_9FLAO|nr:MULTISPECIES: threonine ammonia-lyase IlvA [Flavobacteriaceae]TEW74995.1 threonine ammonia-lyase IlvA [Gramella jeungdoensis]GGK42477.1 L-threonine dehydratase [Lutibacter litoralis]